MQGQAYQGKPVGVVFSFFAGCGLLDLGFERTGFDVALVNEISPAFLKAYKYSRSKMQMPPPRYGYRECDINEFLGARREELGQLVEDARGGGRLLGFIGGPPCPDFSVAGKNKGAGGVNGRLSLDFIRLIAETAPDFFLFENVKGLWSTARHRAYFEELKSMTHDAGFATAERLCNALEFGVPQDRERVFFFGVQKKLAGERSFSGNELSRFPWERRMTHDAKRIKSMPWAGTNDFGQDAVPPFNEELRPLTVQYWFDKNDVERHPNARDHFRPRSGIEKMRTVREGDVSRKSYKRLHRSRYSPTAAYGNNEVHLHPFKERRLSAAEAMAVQSLPKEFELPPDMSLSDMFKTIGNGVPYLMSYGIAGSVQSFLERLPAGPEMLFPG